jgi:hypoxanthine phosphoribosyltransferase
MKKIYLDANDLLLKSYQLAVNILNSGFKPDFILAIWRGGTPVGIAVQELMEYVGVSTDHIAIRTSSYIGLDKRDKKVRVHNLGYLLDNINDNNKLLIVDDVFDTGKSIEAVLATLHKKARKNTPKEIKIATPYYKPEKNKTNLIPDFYIEKTEEWLVFPHELCGLEREEIYENKTGIKDILRPFHKSMAKEKR